MAIFDKKCAFFITGASRGYGRAVVKAIAEELSRGALNGEGSLVVGTSRAEERLSSLKDEIASVCPKLECRVLCIQLDDVETMVDTLSSVVDVDPSSYDVGILIHNAGDAGDVSISCAQQKDPKEVQKCCDLNMNSMLQLTGAFLRQFENSSCQRFVINISSLLAVAAFPGCHMYCMTKAARDMYINVLVKEEPSVRCLNWAPGPMPTDIFKELGKSSYSAVVRESFAEMLADKTYVPCEASAAKLMGVIKENKFDSGAHIDYYDV